MKFEVENIGKPWSQERLTALEALVAKLGVKFNSSAMEHQHATHIFEDGNNIAFVSKNDITFYQILNGELSLSKYIAAHEIMQQTGCKRSKVEGKFVEMANMMFQAMAEINKINKKAAK